MYSVAGADLQKPSFNQGNVVNFFSIISEPACAILLLIAALAVLPARSSGAQNSMPLQAQAEESHGQYSQAIRDYRAILAKSPRLPSALSGLGKSEAAIGKCGDAEKTFRKLAAPDPAEAFLLGVCHFRVHEFPEAIAQLQKAARLAPRDEQVRIFLARAYAGEGRNSEAIETLKTWMKEHGENADALYWIGNFYEDLANTTFEQLASKNPESYLVYEMKGGQDLARQQYPEALAAYKKALELAPPGTPGLHFHLGDVYWRMLRYEEAKKELEQELKRNPYHAQANYELGNINVKQGNPQQAIPYLQKALALDPTLTEAHRSLGRAYLDEKRYPEAIEEFQQVAQAEPSDHTIHAMLASAYRLTGRLDEAKAEAQKSQKLERQTIQQIQANKAAEKNLGRDSTPKL